MSPIIVNLLLEEAESTTHSADMSEKPLTGTCTTMDDLEQLAFEEYTKARAAALPYGQLLTLIKEQANRISELTGKHVSYRSLITKMSKKGIYGNKKEILEEQGIESKGRKITDDAGDYPPLVHRCSDMLEAWSKDRLLIELESKLELHPGALFSLRCGNRLAIMSIILAIKDVSNGLLEPDLESLFNTKPQKEKDGHTRYLVIPNTVRG